MTTLNIGGPVSAALEADLRGWARRTGVVLWLDLHDDYSGFVDRLMTAREGGALPYEVRAFRGSHLELMLELQSLADGVDKPPLVVHLPGFNEESVKSTPLYELYAAGTRYRKKLDTLVTDAAAGRVRREQIDAFQTQEGLSLDGADAWLAALLEGSDGDLANQLRGMSLPSVVDDLLRGGFVSTQIALSDARDAVWEHLYTCTGLADAWRSMSLPLERDRDRPADVAFAVASWALAVEYTDELRRDPVSPLLAPALGLPRAVIDACRGLAEHLRSTHATFYKRAADDTEFFLAEEAEKAQAEDLGEIDTFRFEENKVLEAALVALEVGRWATAAEWAGLRIKGGSPSPLNRRSGSFWLSEDPTRRSAWELVSAAAGLGLRVEAAGPRLKTPSGLADAVDRYVSHGAAVDQAHRQLEQRRLALLYPRLPQFERLRARLDGMRLVWRAWADGWAKDFSEACRTHGFLPDAALQQRTLFDEVVRPMTNEPGVTAYFVVDALRFEMAEELFEALKDTPATTVHLRARLAELPSVTAVGMNVLAPVASGGALRLSLEGSRVRGFSTGEFRVSTPETRRRAMHARVGGGTCPWLSLQEVLDSDSLKRSIAQAKLVVVHSLEIDDAGEKGAGPAVFEHALRKVRAAWRLLRDAGVRRFVITSDHGFLLLDSSTAPALAHGRKIDPKRRHVFSPVPADHTGEARVALSDLGYQGASGHLMFPETTAVFDTGKRSMSFVHGGNSLQERVIPVLTLVHRSGAGGSTVSYTVVAKADEALGDMHALAGEVTVDQQALSFGGQREVELALRPVDAPGVQVELCQVRRGARLVSGTIHAKVEQRFEVFFRLIGQSEARIRVELHHPSAAVELAPYVVEQRFEVITARGVKPTTEVATPDGRWLEELPEGGVRELFAHLEAHAAVTEPEAMAMLGGARPLRRFARSFEEYAAKAPFAVRIDVVGGIKRYVREGSKR